jgi:iron complex transport system substrate-binding protein
VFLADTKCCGQTADTLAQRPGFEGLSAIASKSVVELDDDVASRWGPRTVDFVKAIVDGVLTVTAK